MAFVRLMGPLMTSDLFEPSKRILHDIYTYLFWSDCRGSSDGKEGGRMYEKNIDGRTLITRSEIR